VALATGRRYDFARPIFSLLAPPITLLLSNGAIVKTHDGDTLMRRLLPRDVARRVLARTPHHRDTAALVFDRPRERQVVFERLDWDHPRHRRYFETNRPFLGECCPLEDALDEDPVQVMFTGSCGPMRSLFDMLRSTGGEGTAGEYSVALTEYLHRDFSLVDVVRAGCTKGSTLAEWASRRGIAAADIMAIGDNLNDLEMLEAAGLPIVMENAVPELKRRGWTVTASNDRDGVAAAVETYVLGEAS
jgi:hydroxymethylpyrimidine pyrophosphatase-like HAD family hydrolase